MPGFYLEDLSLGQAAEIVHVVTDADLHAFAAVSGDDNPVHLDEAFAATTAFGGRVAHGMLGGAYISAVLGTKLPGPGAIYLSQSLKFRRPIRIGDEVTTRVTIGAIDARRGFVTLHASCLVGGKVAVDGEAVVQVKRRPA